MIRPAASLIVLVFYAALAATCYGQAPDSSVFRIGYTDFVPPMDDKESWGHLIKELPRALMAELVKYDAFTALERERQGQLNEVIEREGGFVYDAETVARIGRRVGSNAILKGEINPRGDEIRIDAQIVILESGIWEVSDYLIRPKDELIRQSDIAIHMKALAERLQGGLLGETLGPDNLPINSLSELSVRLAELMPERSAYPPGTLLIAPFTYESTARFSPFSDGLRNMLAHDMANVAGWEPTPGPSKRMVDAEAVPRAYARAVGAGYVLSGSYGQDGDMIRLQSLLHDSRGRLLAAPQVRVKMAVVTASGRGMEPVYDLSCWQIPCLPRTWGVGYRLIPGLAHLRYGQPSKGKVLLAWAGASFIVAVVGYFQEHRARQHVRAGNPAHRDFYTRRANDWELVWGTAATFFLVSEAVNNLSLPH